MPEQPVSHQETQFGSPEANLGAVRRPTAPADQAGGECELVIFWVRRSTHCGECGVDLERGSLLRVEGGRALCLTCADLDDLEYLPRGDAALTRRARRTSVLQAVVVEWSRTRQRYERQGVLVEPAALRQAEEECLADAELRARRREQGSARREIAEQAYTVAFAAAVRAQFPGCPDTEADQIAAHACRKASGRIGRTAAAKALDPQVVALAVAAHVRHVHTDYDRLLGRLIERGRARDQVRDRVDRILHQWAVSRAG
jgi:hypothetical protein